MIDLFGSTYKNKSVFITGNTGFKGSWMSIWLHEMGAIVNGYSLDNLDEFNHLEILSIPINTTRNDIKNIEKLKESLEHAAPEIVFHLAAQPLVRRSYLNPIETWYTNVIGTANLLEACRNVSTIKAIIIITSDKVYENKDWNWGYRENDKIGGHDPYSASKAAVELVVSSYRKSFFNKEYSPKIITVRAGNVIGGGDWSEDRLIPDIIRSISKNRKVEIRYPNATRPWQHVLDCISGYLLTGKYLLDSRGEPTLSLNFGPSYFDNRMVLEIFELIRKVFPDLDYNVIEGTNIKHEAKSLFLDSTESYKILRWKPVWKLELAVQKTAEWYKSFLESNEIISKRQILEYVQDAKKMELEWAKN